MSEPKWTPGPWYVRDFRACEMRRLGWVGPAIDRILITNKTGPEIEASSGADCVIARIQFDNRPEELTDGNLADATLIAAAPEMYDALVAIREWLLFTDTLTKEDAQFWAGAFVKANNLTVAAIAKARGEQP